METTELKHIWNTLANNKLIDEQLAKENISRIITNNGNGLFAKMKSKLSIDYWAYLLGLIFVPVITSGVHLHLMQPLPTVQAYVGIVFIEIYLVYMFVNARRKLTFIEYTNNNLSIKEGLFKLQEKLKQSMRKEYKLSMIFGLVLICFAILQFIITGGGFSTRELSEFTTIAVIILVVLLILFPFMLKLEFKIRFSGIIKDLDKTIDELNAETE